MSKKLTIANDPLAFLGQDEVVTLLIDEIEVEEQVRKEFGLAEINELADSIKQVGIINPPVIRIKDGHYIMLDGERRLKACKLLGMDKILCSIKEIKDEDVRVAQMIANIHRKDLTDVELYYGLKLYQDEGLSIRDLVERTGMKKGRIEELLKARKFEDKLKDLPPGDAGNKEFRKLAASEGITDPAIKAEVQSNVGNFSRTGIDKIKKNSKPQKANKNKTKKESSEIRTPEGGEVNQDGKSGNQDGTGSFRPKNPRDIEIIEKIDGSMKLFNDSHISIKLQMTEDADGYHLNIRVGAPATAEQIVDAINKIFN